MFQLDLFLKIIFLNILTASMVTFAFNEAKVTEAMELREREVQKDRSIQEIFLEGT